MTELFAGVTAQGETRFIGEVTRGAACGCFCPFCNSPLVAKHGEINEWHFGHLAMQERPECAVGAHNLLRRLGVQYLHDLPQLILPLYKQVLTRQGRFGQIREVVEWQSEVVKVTDWNLAAARGQSIGVLTLRDGAKIDMFIDIGSQRPSHQSHLSHGKIVFYCPVPDPESLRTQDKAREWLRYQGEFVWVFQPDVNGHVASANQRLVDRFQEMEGALHELEIRALEKGMNLPHSRQWAVDAYRERKQQKPEGPAALTMQPAQKRAHEIPWSSQVKPMSMLFYWRLKTGEAWVMYERIDQSRCVAPWPECVEGWDESLPQTVGAPDLTLAAYIVRDLANAMIWMNSRAATARNTSNMEELFSF
jgi:hypothetical protein